MCNEDGSAWLHGEKVQEKRNGGKLLKILILLIENYKLGDGLCFSPFLFYKLVKRIVWGGGKVEKGNVTMANEAPDSTTCLLAAKGCFPT